MSSPPSDADRLPRFSRGERWAHRSLAVLTSVCVATGAVLYLGPLSAAVGQRDVVRVVHFVSGVLMVVPIALALVLSGPFRDDVQRLGRFLDVDWAWLRRSELRGGALPVGKFNAGQKLNASFVLGSTLVLLGTGLMLRYFSLVPEELRPGATLVHDLTALAFTVVTAGHLAKAWADPGARAGMRTGEVGAGWARHHHRGWAEEMAAGD